MLNRTWRIVLLVVALVAMIWPDLLGASTWWISLIAVTLLLIGELNCSECDAPMRSAPRRKRVARKRTAKRRRR